MAIFKILSLFFGLIITLPVFAQKNIRLKSPDGNIVFSFKLEKNVPVYQVAFKEKTLIGDSKLGFSFKENGDFGTNVKMSKPTFKNVDETYELTVGKTKTVHNVYKEVLIPLIAKSGLKRQINLVVRVFNDGPSFSLRISKAANLDILYSHR